ncbi:hypothetical protein CUJ84_Chr002696 [Rhizobium leguminosarum]|uniref:Uncharacterized protein n=1 Tax=Rhizobium leguminosarum TaxID=384 RepID=A0A2K9Z489_RHILE|nr:hypothetical protein CUJ84_Chr002696 [Rhizobium leguminosarum]
MRGDADSQRRRRPCFAFAAAGKLQATRSLAGRGKPQGGSLLWAASGNEQLLRLTTHETVRGSGGSEIRIVLTDHQSVV